MRFAVSMSTVLAFAVSSAVAAPAGDQVVQDVRKNCKITVPSDWTIELSTAYSPGKKASATVHGMRAGQSFADAKQTVQQAMKPVKVVQDDAKRFLYTMDPGKAGVGKNGWYAVIPSTPVCTVSFTFGDGFDEASLRKIADSLAPAK